MATQASTAPPSPLLSLTQAIQHLASATDRAANASSDAGQADELHAGIEGALPLLRAMLTATHSALPEFVTASHAWGYSTMRDEIEKPGWGAIRFAMVTPALNVKLAQYLLPILNGRTAATPDVLSSSGGAAADGGNLMLHKAGLTTLGLLNGYNIRLLTWETELKARQDDYDIGDKTGLAKQNYNRFLKDYAVTFLQFAREMHGRLAEVVRFVDERLPAAAPVVAPGAGEADNSIAIYGEWEMDLRQRIEAQRMDWTETAECVSEIPRLFKVIDALRSELGIAGGEIHDLRQAALVSATTVGGGGAGEGMVRYIASAERLPEYDETVLLQPFAEWVQPEFGRRKKDEDGDYWQVNGQRSTRYAMENYLGWHPLPAPAHPTKEESPTGEEGGQRNG